MTVSYGFFNSVGGDRKYNAEDVGRYLQGIVSDGVYADASTSLQVLAGSGMVVTVQAGRGMLDHHFMENTEPLELTLSAAGTQDRIDAVVMRLDMERRLCEIAVKEGTPAVTPKRPSLFRTDNTKEYMLASVYVKKLATTITQEEITDTRADSSVCGWVTGVIDHLDTSALMVQWQAAYEAARAKMHADIDNNQAEYDEWFAGLPEPEDGVGVASVEQTTTSTADDGNNVITVTLTNGQKFTFTVQNGSKGSKGDAPKRGTDYWTTADKNAIVNDVLDALPEWTGGSY